MIGLNQIAGVANGGSVSTLAKNLTIHPANGIELQVVSSLTASTPLKANLIITFDNSKLVRALKPLVFSIGLNGSGTAASTNIIGCANTAEPPICALPNTLSYDGTNWSCNPPFSCPNGQFFNGYDKDGNIICSATYTPSLRGSCRLFFTQAVVAVDPRDCWGTAAPATQANNWIVCKNNGKRVIMGVGDDTVGSMEYTLNPDGSNDRKIIDYCTDCVFLELGCMQ
ncbi:MAG TPA: hypothetical protein PLJ21_06000 [Pseudobdellovibrionaceae bacterium]|nr:hypothetical protein [Pseudobdellovibrionaceae bacterium]